MPTLIEKLNTGEVRPKVIRACEDLIEAEVATKSGIAGLAVKAAYKCLFKPAKQRDVPVKARITLPFRFRLN